MNLMKSRIDYFTRSEWALILLTGMGYFLNLYLLRGQNILKQALFGRIPEELAVDVDKFGGYYLMANAIGLVVGAFLYGFFADTYSRRKALIVSMFLHAIAWTLPYVFSLATYVQESHIYLWRFVTGMMAAGEYAIGITLIVEQVPRTKRLWATALSTSIGLLGVSCFAIIYAFSYSFHLTTLFGLGLSLLVLGWRIAAWWNHVEDRQKLASAEHSFKLWGQIFSDKTHMSNLFFLALACLPIQFMINFLIQNVKEYNFNDEQYQSPEMTFFVVNWSFFTYYTCFSIAMLGLAWVYAKLQRPFLLVRYALIVQLLAVCVFILPNPSSLPYLILKCALLSLGVGIWWLISLVTLENAKEEHRASNGLFVVNFVRAAIISLIFGGQLDPKNYVLVILVTLTVLGIAWLATVSLKDRFSPKIQKAGEGSSMQLLSSPVITTIRGHQSTLMRDKNVQDYLDNCAEILKHAIFRNFNTCLFALYSIEEKGYNTPVILRSRMEKDDTSFETTPETPSTAQVDDVRKIAKILIDQRLIFSFTKEVLDKNIPGIVVFYAPKPFRRGPLRWMPPLFAATDKEMPQGFQHFDLGEIDLTATQLQHFLTIDPSDTTALITCLDAYSSGAFANVSADAAQIIERWGEPKNTHEEKTLQTQMIRRSLLLHKLDAMRHRQNYFSYLIGPYYEEENGVIFLTTNYPATSDQLQELNNLATIIMNAVFVVRAKDTTFRDIVDQNMHNQNTILASIDYNLTKLENKYAESQSDFQGLRFHFGAIYNVSNLFYAMQKTAYRQANLSGVKLQAVRDVLSHRTVRLADLVTQRIHTIRDATVNLLHKKEQTVAMRAYLDNLSETVQRTLGDTTLEVNETALQVVLQDMLSNAVRYSGNPPDIGITLYPTDAIELPDELPKDLPVVCQPDAYWTLAVRNNMPLGKHIYREILGLNAQVRTGDTSRRLGINTIKRILDYEGLGQSGQPWYFVPRKNCYETPDTILLLLIPKRDFHV